MRYTNPVLKGDYSDPDVIRVGEYYYLISSSFTYLPGIPVLRSADLAHWEQVSWAVERLPFERYNRPCHKCGTWAPSIRWHEGLFHIYVCLPDEGLMCYTAKKPEGPWEEHYVKDVTGWIDPCPFWDEDGQAYLVHGFANSRIGIKNILYLHRMSWDGLHILDTGRLVYSGDDHGDTTVEGPKMYKRDGRYYILCPAGGVATGYQLALRAESPWGPYEKKIVLSQGDTPVNGPHQGGWVDTPEGESYFLHFQDLGCYGRVVHLQKVEWKDGWPEMGDGGKPQAEGDAPERGRMIADPVHMSDPLRGSLGIRWQWQANPNPAWYREGSEGLTLYAKPFPTLYEAGSFLSQLMQDFSFEARVRVRPDLKLGDRAGLGMMGNRYSFLYVDTEGIHLAEGEVTEGSRFSRDRIREAILEEVRMEIIPGEIWFYMTVRDGKVSYAWDAGEGKRTIGKEIPMTPGGWTGARPGIFCFNALDQVGGKAVFSDFEVWKDHSATGEKI